MASFHFHVLLLLGSFVLLLNQFHAQIPHLPNHDAVLLPVTKDAATLQYLTKIHLGNSLVPTKLVIDLGGPFLWTDCASRHVSSSVRLVPSCSIHCAKGKANYHGIKGCQFGTNCRVSTKNSITALASKAEVAEDILAIRSVDGSKPNPISILDSFLFSCVSSFALSGLASGARGMLGLGRTTIALPSQLAATFGYHRKFATCLSSSDGVIFLGYESSSTIFGTEVSRSLMYTPLVTDPAGEYFINVKSVKINNKKLSLNQEGIIGSGKLSSAVPYTTMESSIYSKFVQDYIKAATFMNMTIVEPVAPFGLCFSSKGVASGTLAGQMVPTIDLVLQSEMAKWRVHGKNAMVAVGDEVMCLGFLDGGLNPNTPIVIGGFQLEDNLLEFDFGSSMLGFSSLSVRQTSCSSYTKKFIFDEWLINVPPNNVNCCFYFLNLSDWSVTLPFGSNLIDIANQIPRIEAQCIEVLQRQKCSIFLSARKGEEDQ